MSNIKLTDLNRIVGTDLFTDSEDFMKDLSEDELDLQGGMKGIRMTVRDTVYRFKTPGVLPTPIARELD
jgi:hypothetical protein